MKPQLPAMTKRGRQLLVEEARKAQAAGHTIEVEQRRPKSLGRTREATTPGTAAGQLVKNRKRSKWVTTCSCGWESHVLDLKIQALAKACLHLGEVSADLHTEFGVPLGAPFPAVPVEVDENSGVSVPRFVTPPAQHGVNG